VPDLRPVSSVIYKRCPARGEGIEILGDGQLLHFWLERVGFG
jgi:hypothetical protein